MNREWEVKRALSRETDASAAARPSHYLSAPLQLAQQVAGGWGSCGARPHALSLFVDRYTEISSKLMVQIHTMIASIFGCFGAQMLPAAKQTSIHYCFADSAHTVRAAT
jgi:hypothetical protein